MPFNTENPNRDTTDSVAAYLTPPGVAPNIIHPQSERGSAGEPQVLAAETRARAALLARYGANGAYAGMTIRRGR
jgi:hypothetical protein